MIEKQNNAKINSTKVNKLHNEDQQFKKQIANYEAKIEQLKQSFDKQTSKYSRITNYSIQLSNKAFDELPQFIAQTLRDIFEVKAVWVSTFDEKKQQLRLDACTLLPEEETLIKQFVGNPIIAPFTPVNSDVVQKMIAIKIGPPSTLNTISFNQISEETSQLVHNAMKIGWFQGTSFSHRGKLIGGMLIAGHKEQIPINEEQLGTFIELTSNILQRKKVENDLIVSERRFREMTDLLPQIVFEIDMQGILTFVNKFALDLLGYTYTELSEGLSISEVVAPEDLPFAIQRIKEVFNGADTTPKELKISKRNGEIFPVILQAEVIMDEGYCSGMRGIGIDISEIKEAEEQIHLKNQQLKKINAEKDKLLSIIAHDLRSPFNSFIGFTELLTEEVQTLSPAKLEEIAKSMKESATNLYALLENLLEWSKTQREGTAFNPQKIKLHEEVCHCLELVGYPASKKNISFDINIPQKFDIMADRPMLDTIIRNLISNAIKFTRKNGKVEISAHEENSGILIRVKDNGIGMSNELIDRLFKIDNMANRLGTDGEPSTGLGLAICKELVEKHQGKIWATSQVNKGSVFYFFIPNTFSEAEN